ncbi:paired amphipathic helix protein Sin3a [Nephila pilipes]|uniref:Paired amphipathic helix protein Sin3a n=1 Tax=Nephila pilipes TaxID=299642 RepID=A0A8X6PFJ1_NEPPI|nr:paired amphipathic helix protein Sin3a [Nephila pilipes]
MNKDKLASLQDIAYQQQASLLAHAHTQALKKLIENRQAFKLTVEDALAYCEMAKAQLSETEFSELMSLIQQCSKENCDIIHILAKISCILQDYSDVMQGFGMFLPPDLNLQLQTGGFSLLHKIKTEDEEDSIVIKSEPEEISNSPSEEQMMEVSPKETDLDLSQNDSLDKKDPNYLKEIDGRYAKSFLNKVKERFKEEVQIFEKFLQLLNSVRSDSLCDRNDLENDVFLEVLDLFQGHDDLIEEFKPFVPNAVCESQEEDVEDISDIEPKMCDENSLSQPDSIDISKISVVNDPSIAPVYKYGSFEEHLFFDNVRAAVRHKEVYDNFLRCLMLFNEDVITRSELLKISTSFLGKFPDLHRKFKDMLGFKENNDNIEAIPMKIITLEILRNKPEIGADIDFSAGGRNGASYRALPQDFEQPKCSGRTALCKEVLNDTWVSFPSWSEDSTFVTSCKTQYEEIIYRCEDERFELDMAISANGYTLQILDNVQKKIHKMTTEEKSMFSLDNSLGGTSTVLQQRALHRLYGDKTEELVEGLKRNPLVAVPIILKRLKVKEDEWKDKEKKFNELWRNQIDQYYLKSLDHQGINFKQNDSKSFRPKSLLNEMEMVYAENKENQTVSNAHFILEFKEMEVFLDAINLMLQYLKKLPGVYRDDRRRIELVIRSFIPDFFCAPRATKIEEDLEMDEEIRGESMDVDNDGEERSGQNSSAGSNKDEGEVSSEEDSNEEDLSDESSKAFIEESDVFDKMDPLPTTNLPYALFFVSKTWFIFFRQFHILFERLSRLLYESNRKEALVKQNENGDIYIQEEKPKPSYRELIERLSQLLSGAIDYSQFEEDARSFFGIHAFVSFTMDKLILSVVRQLQQVVTDDMCKQCTAFFIQHTKNVSTGGYTSPLEASQIEYEYLRKIEKMMDDEKLFKIVWHKKDCALTIELLEYETEETHPDPIEAEKWSNYLDNYVTEDSCCDELLAEVQQSPVILPRNLRKQMLFWKNRAAQVEKQWHRRQSAKYLKKHLPLSVRKRRALSVIAPMLRKKQRHSSIPEGSVHSSCSGVASNDGNEPTFFDNSESIEEPVIEILKEEEEEEELDSKEELNKVIVDGQVTIETEEQLEKPEIVVIEKEEICLENEPVVIDAADLSSSHIQTEEVSAESPKSESEIADQDFNEATIDDTIKEDAPKEEIERMEIDENSCTSVISSEKKDSFVEPEDISEEKSDMLPEIITKNTDSEIDLKSKDDIVVEIPHHVMETIKTDNIKEEGETISDSDSVDKTEETETQTEKLTEKKQLKRKIIQKTCDYSIKTRKNRINQTYVKRKMKRGILRSLHSSKGKRRRQAKYKFEVLDDPTFDFTFFSELSEGEKGSYLAMKYVTVEDDVEGAFKKGSYKIYFVQNCDLFVHRKGSLTRAQEAHQAVSEIKTSNFNAWHRIWLDRYVTPSMLKYCNDWLLKSDPEKYKLMRVTVSDCTKPPYIPYNKYKVRYYKSVT